MPQPKIACDRSLRPATLQPAIAAKRPLTLLGHVHVVVRGIVDDASDDLSFALERDRNREQGNRVEEVGRRIKRIDVPCVALVCSLDRPLSSMTKP